MKRRLFLGVVMFCFMFVLFVFPVHAQLASSPWPMFHANAQHIGQSAYAGSQKGTLFWSYRTGEDVSSSSAIGSDGRVYVGSYDNRIYCLNPTGSLLWSYRTGDDVRSSPAIGSDGRVYVGSYNNSIYCLNPTGSLLWTYRTGYPVFSSPAIGSDGRVYVGSGDNRLYVFYETPTITPTMTPTMTPTPTPIPTAVIELNGTSFVPGEKLMATFKLNESITRRFTTFAVLILPKGQMLNALTLDRPVRPVAAMSGLTAPFTHPLISGIIPGNVPKGEYELVVAFFDPTKLITGRADAFLDVSAKFTIQ
jgi:hypothetical protein